MHMVGIKEGIKELDRVDRLSGIHSCCIQIKIRTPLLSLNTVFLLVPTVLSYEFLNSLNKILRITS